MSKQRSIPRYVSGRTPILADDLNSFKRTHDRFGNMRGGRGVDILDGGTGPVIRATQMPEDEINFGAWFSEVNPDNAAQIAVGRQRGFDDYAFEDEVRMHLPDGDRIVVKSTIQTIAAATTGTYIYLEAEKTGADAFTVTLKADTDKPDQGHADRDADKWWLILGKVISAAGGVITEYKRWRVGNWRIDFAEGGATCTSSTPNDLSAVAWWYGNAGTFSDGGSTAATDGGTIQQWNDNTGNGHLQEQVVNAVFKPKWDEFVPEANNQAGVVFDGTDFMVARSKIINTLVQAGKGFEVHAVVANLQTSGGLQYLLAESTTVTSGVLMNGPGKNGNLRIEYGRNAGLEFSHGIAMPTGQDITVCSAGFTGNQGTGTGGGGDDTGAFVFLDGKYVAGGPAANALASFLVANHNTSIASTSVTGLGSPWKGTIMSLAIFELSATAPMLTNLDRAALDCWAFETFGTLNNIHNFGNPPV